MWRHKAKPLMCGKLHDCAKFQGPGSVRLLGMLLTSNAAHATLKAHSKSQCRTGDVVCSRMLEQTMMQSSRGEEVPVPRTVTPGGCNVCPLPMSNLLELQDLADLQTEIA